MGPKCIEECPSSVIDVSKNLFDNGAPANDFSFFARRDAFESAQTVFRFLTCKGRFETPGNFISLQHRAIFPTHIEVCDRRLRLGKDERTYGIEQNDLDIPE